MSEIEKLALITLARACNQSLSAHVPEEALRGIRSDMKGDVRKALKVLYRKGYCVKHPTGGGITWQLTTTGLEAARKLISDDIR